MPNTYTQIHIHVVFSVQNRLSLIGNDWKKELYRYICGIVERNEHKVLAINGMPDHIHILFGMRTQQALADLMQDVKGASSKWINEKNFLKRKFSWQEGYGAFSYSKSHVPNVIKYIEEQEKHHAGKSFIEEYIELLNIFEIDYDEKYIFKKVE